MAAREAVPLLGEADPVEAQDAGSRLPPTVRRAERTRSGREPVVTAR